MDKKNLNESISIPLKDAKVKLNAEAWMLVLIRRKFGDKLHSGLISHLSPYTRKPDRVVEDCMLFL